MLAAADARVKAVISIATPADLGVYVPSVSTYFPGAGAAIAQFMGGLPGEVPAIYEVYQPQALAARITQPVLLVHGAADMRVPIDYVKRLEVALRDAGNARVQLEIIPGMGHFLELGTVGYQFDRVLGLSTSWLDERLSAKDGAMVTS
jgi:dipeptidyl aminopeptidase/acylaminoacyl peptidase